MKDYLNFLEALLLEEIAQGEADVNENYVPSIIYVNGRPSDENAMSVIQNLHSNGSLVKEMVYHDRFIYKLSDKGKRDLWQSMRLKK